MKYNNLKLLAITAIAATLTACGGGGGGSSSNGGSTPSGTTPVAQNLQPATSPTYSPTSAEYAFFTSVNAFRTAEGLGPLNEDTCYDKAAAAHLNYELLNYPSQGLSHSETQGSPGYTGGSPEVRLTYQGCSFSYGGELIGTYPQQFVGQASAGAASANDLIASVYHRAGFMTQGISKIGISVGLTGADPFAIADIGFDTQQVNSGTYFGVYPLPNQTGVGLNAVAESPNPYPASVTNIGTQTGYPISVASQESTTLTVSTFTVTQSGSNTPMATYPLYTGQDPNLTGNNNIAFLVATQQFQPNTVYTVHFVGTITGAATGTTSGIPIDQTWNFTTGNGS